MALTILKVAAAILLAVLILLLAAYAAARIWLRRVVAQVKVAETAESAESLHLDPCESVPSAVLRKMEAGRSELLSLGFVEAGSFTVREIPDVAVRGFVRFAGNTYASQMFAPGRGAWTDIFSRFEDGTSCSASNMPGGGALRGRPGHEEIYIADPDAAAVVRAHENARGARVSVPAAKENFARAVEDAHAEEMAWRRRTGGITEEEVRRIVERDNMNVSEKELQLLVSQATRKNDRALLDLLRQSLLRTDPGLQPALNGAGQRAVWIHDAIAPAALKDEFLSWQPAEADVETESDGGAGSRELFRRWNALLPPLRRFSRLGGVEAPVPADLYIAPED